MLKSDDVSERVWAVSNLAQFNRTKLVALLEDLVRSANEKQRDFARGILEEIRVGRFRPDPALSMPMQSGE
jgi:hypothetical protein